MAFSAPFCDFIFTRVILMIAANKGSRWHLFFVAIVIISMMLLGGCDDQPVRSNTVKTLTQSQNFVFEPVVKGEPIIFPRDYGEHPQYLAEWWYLTANLKTETGKEISVQWTLFRMATSDDELTGWKTPQMYMAHAVITTKKKIWTAERFARGGIGQAGVSLKPFRAWLDNWSWRAPTSNPFPGELEFSDDAMLARLNITQNGTIILQGDEGYSQKHPLLGIASYYYSAPFLNIDGIIELDGTQYKVNGRGWFDREWSSSMLSAKQQGWDWFSIHLADGSALMVSQLREKGQTPYFIGSRSWPDGTMVTLDNNQIRMKPMHFREVSGISFPLSWLIEIPSQGLKLQTNVVRRDQWLHFLFPYWEGPINVTGSQKGKGFMELTGYEQQ
ncbi:Hydroxyneurosporene synthase (CrtC) [Photobacterium andalusiense]|uniref:Hydroxyneurosporene synthase (CrtC) n=2 Tax=Photobacterium andalusiense TaxID=2204296 RepID=A0A1Y6M9X6_9GAMM|nr:Hydroxyneurosporene synthase (CrtC) [Photobacterium andalusiense]